MQCGISGEIQDDILKCRDNISGKMGEIQIRSEAK